MKQYVISEIYSYGYERFALVEEIGRDLKMNVHFLECDEYLENGEKSGKKKRGDILEGNISIELVTYSRKTDDRIGHCQSIQKSPNIKAVIKVAQIIDDYSVYAVSSLSDDIILIEFESAVNYREGESVVVVGSLELREA